MQTRRVAPFLLGAWIGCSVLIAFLVVQITSLSGQIAGSASAPAAKIIQKLSSDEGRLLLRYHGVELMRSYIGMWELTQLVLGAVLLTVLILASQRKVLPLVLCGLMILAVLGEHFVLYPDLIFRGREADFPPGNLTFGTQARLWAVEQLYLGLDALKLLVGGVLASYLFMFSGSTVRKVRKRSEASPGVSPA